MSFKEHKQPSVNYTLKVQESNEDLVEEKAAKDKDVII